MRANLRASAYLLAACLILAAGCAHEVVRQSVTLTPAAATSSQVFEIQQDAEIVLDSGYSRRLTRSSRWAEAGTLPQGQVQKIIGCAFTVEGAHVHEAWRVAAGGELVGCYFDCVRKVVTH